MAFIPSRLPVVHKHGRIAGKKHTRVNKADEVAPDSAPSVFVPSLLSQSVAQGINETPEALSQHIEYDSPLNAQQAAVLSYLKVQNFGVKERAMALFGIDIFV